MSQNYTESNIQVLSDIEHVRMRPGMYIGEGENPTQLVQEILDNAIDEAQSGESSLTEIVVSTSRNEYTITDRGRGIPQGTKLDKNGVERPVVEILFTNTNSGGKFSSDAYLFSGGLHGVGSTVVNALSNYVIVETTRDGVKKTFRFENSALVSTESENVDKSLHGTSVTFQPNPEYFESNDVPREFLINKGKILNASGFKTTLVIDGVPHEFTENKLSDLLPESKSTYTSSEFTYTHPESGEIIKVVVKYGNNSGFHFNAYSNLLHNRYGGTHVNSVKNAIIDVWSPYNREVETELARDDYLYGCDLVVSVFLHKLAFSSQTKEKLTVTPSSIYQIVEGFKRQFDQWLKKNWEVRKGLLKRFEEYRISQNRLSNQKEVTKLVKINNQDTSNMRRRAVVPGLLECTNTKQEGTELYLVEGRSAAGSVARARDVRYHAVLPLRGKILNVTFKDIKTALKSEIILNIVNAVGAGVGDQSDPTKSRYEKIIISTDADPDGAHITALLCSVFINLMPNLVKSGYVYVLEAPLYGYKRDRKWIYTNDQSELPEKFTRFKGLGEMDDKQYRDACINPENRALSRLMYPDDLDKFNDIVGTSEGRSDLLVELGVLVSMSDW